jgi:heptaprenyl diphosphate synthase
MKLDFHPGGAAPTPPAADFVERLEHELLEEDMARFRAMIDVALAPQAEYLTETERDLYRRGKKVRPMLLLLCARMVCGLESAPEKVIKGAVSLEMLHVATLIHDDVVDHAKTRRGMATVNAARGMETAVIIGDMQFVQAIRGFVDAIDSDKDMGLVKLVLDTAFRICCGELDELHADPSQPPEQLREMYMRTADRKTAVLFGLACEAGITLAGGRTTAARRAGFYGRRVGLAFQIIDDLFDLAMDSATAGKPQAADLAMRRLSLPIIFAMEELGPDHLVSRVMRGGEFSDADLLSAAAAVRRSNGFARAYAEARGLIADALSYLPPFPPNRFRAALEKMAHFIVDRSF